MKKMKAGAAKVRHRVKRGSIDQVRSLFFDHLQEPDRWIATPLTLFNEKSNVVKFVTEIKVLSPFRGNIVRGIIEIFVITDEIIKSAMCMPNKGSLSETYSNISFFLEVKNHHKLLFMSTAFL
jgi:hypothetical protein